MSTRTRILIILALIAGYLWFASAASVSTLVAIVFEGREWSIPAEIHVAAGELREAGHEIRMIDVDAENGDGGEPAELVGCLNSAKKHGLPAIVFQSGAKFSASPVPETGDALRQAIE